MTKLNSSWEKISTGLTAAIEIEAAVQAFVQKLSVVPDPRPRIEHLRPKAIQEANTESLSGKFGYSRFPLHCDTAHWPIPCRYLVLACITEGHQPVSTRVLSLAKLALSDRQRRAARNASFLVRNGRASFYSTIASPLREFFRFDPGCMQPLTTEAEEAFTSIATTVEESGAEEIFLQRGEVLLIDNWKCLHGRGPVTQQSANRHLVRGVVR